jgi:hypothetical protein
MPEVGQSGVSKARYKWNIKKASPGNHTITSMAWDLSGNSASATPVVVMK